MIRCLVPSLSNLRMLVKSSYVCLVFGCLSSLTVDRQNFATQAFHRKKIYVFFGGPFLADFGQNWSKIASPGPGRALESFLDALGSILVKYQPIRSHGDPIQLTFYHFLIFFDNCFCENQLFLKKSISRGSSGQSASTKMTIYLSSNSKVLTDF